jgi:hypothetical protein
MLREKVWSSSVRRSLSSAIRARLLERTLRDFRRAGVEPRRVERCEGVVERAVLGELGGELVDLLLGAVALVAHRLVGVHVAEERAGGGDVRQRAGDGVPLLERRQRVGRRLGPQPIDDRPGLGQPVVGAGAQPRLGGVGVRQDERRQRLGTW